jgi:hypothetical protein
LSAYDVVDTWTNFFNIFKKEYGFRIPQIGEVNTMIEYLQGLPSTLNIIYTYYDISELCFNRFNRHGIKYTSGKGEEKIKASDRSYNNFYWYALAVNIFKLQELEQNEVISDTKIQNID